MMTTNNETVSQQTTWTVVKTTWENLNYGPALFIYFGESGVTHSAWVNSQGKDFNRRKPLRLGNFIALTLINITPQILCHLDIYRWR